MKYIRFESLEPLEGTPSRLGIFQIAFRVRDAHQTSVYDSNEIGQHLEWLKTHLRSPDELDLEAHKRAICWFRETAREPMRRVWHIKAYVEAYGHCIDVRTTRTPGNIIYRDGWQIAAIPGR